MTKKYYVKGISQECTHTLIGTTAGGLLVMQRNFDGLVLQPKHPDLVEEAKPRTIQVQFVGGNNRIYNYMLKHSDPLINEGDVLLKTDNKGLAMVRVTSVDEQTQEPGKYFIGTRIETKGTIG